MTMTTTASVTVSYLYGEDTISVTASCQGYPDAIADARAEAVRGLLEIVTELSPDEDEDEDAELAATDETPATDD